MKKFSQFTYRHIGSDIQDQNLMLKEIGCKSLEDLVKSTLPSNILQNDSNFFIGFSIFLNSLNPI